MSAWVETRAIVASLTPALSLFRTLARLLIVFSQDFHDSIPIPWLPQPYEHSPCTFGPGPLDTIRSAVQCPTSKLRRDLARGASIPRTLCLASSRRLGGHSPFCHAGPTFLTMSSSSLPDPRQMDGNGAIEAASLSAPVTPTIWHVSVCMDCHCSFFFCY